MKSEKSDSHKPRFLGRDRPLWLALKAGDFEAAQEQFDALCERHRVQCLGEHEAEWLLGVFVPRDADAHGNPHAAQILELARSWERFDRAFKPASEVVAQRTFMDVGRFLRSAGLSRAIADDHLWVFETAAGLVVLSHTAEGWPGPPSSEQAETVDALFREHLQRGPRLRE